MGLRDFDLQSQPTLMGGNPLIVVHWLVKIRLLVFSLFDSHVVEAISPPWRPPPPQLASHAGHLAHQEAHQRVGQLAHQEAGPPAGAEEDQEHGDHLADHGAHYGGHQVGEGQGGHQAALDVAQHVIHGHLLSLTAAQRTFS